MYREYGFHLLIFLVVLGLSSDSLFAAEETTWKAGTARARLIPKTPDWIVGHNNHKQPVGPRLHELWTKALALEAADGRRAVIVTNDLLILQKGMYENICAQLKSQCDLDRSQIMINCSHTHAGPMLEGPLDIIFGLDDAGRARLAEYSRIVEKTIVTTVVEALAQMTPASLWAGQGRCPFAANRRNNREKEVPDLLARGAALKGPVDHSVPVLAVRTPNGSLQAVLFIYACHATTYKCDQWSGDYPGFAQIGVEQAHPGVQAMFCQGCGADQNPLPRRTLELCKKYGTMLADAVEAELRKPMRPLKPRLKTAFEFVDLEFEKLPTRADLEAAAKKGAYWQHWANHFLKQLDRGASFPKSYPCFPIQVWKLDDQLWIALGGEAVVDYALHSKAKHGPSTWVTTYNHEMMAYIPSHRVWQEGGYESGAFAVYGLPATRWGSDIEQRIAAGVERLVKKLK